MTKTTYMIGVAVVAANCVIANAGNADCVGRADLSALRTAALQQQLMVAALTCHEVGSYNRFVVSHREELLESDDRLKSYFIRHGGEARYHTFKTELANAASLRSIRQSEAFCADAEYLFESAERPLSLAAFVAHAPVALGTSYRACRDDRNTPLTSEASAVPRSRHSEMSGNEEDGGDN